MNGLIRLLATIPPDVQGEWLALPTLQANRAGAWGCYHPGNLGARTAKVGL